MSWLSSQHGDAERQRRENSQHYVHSPHKRVRVAQGCVPGATLPAQRNCRRDETRGNSHTQKRKHEEEQRHEQRSGKLLRVLKIGQQQATHPARGLNHTRRSNKLSAAVANNQPLSRVTVRQSPAHVWSHKSAPSKSSKHQPNSRHCQRHTALTNRTNA